MQNLTQSKSGMGRQIMPPISAYAASHTNTASNDQEYVTFPVIFRWLLMLFAYGWWLIVILPFTL